MLLWTVRAVEAVLTAAQFGTLLSHVIALAVFFLALCSLAVASFN